MEARSANITPRLLLYGNCSANSWLVATSPMSSYVKSSQNSFLHECSQTKGSSQLKRSPFRRCSSIFSQFKRLIIRYLPLFIEMNDWSKDLQHIWANFPVHTILTCSWSWRLISEVPPPHQCIFATRWDKTVIFYLKWGFQLERQESQIRFGSQQSIMLALILLAFPIYYYRLVVQNESCIGVWTLPKLS